MTSVTAWDRRVAVQAWVLATLAWGIALLLTAATDEGGVPWPTRLGRTLPVAPLCAAVGAWIALLPARARGEILALEALGRRPEVSAASGAIGGALLAVLAAGAMAAWPAVDVAGFYPQAPHASVFEADGGGDGFVDRAGGWRVDRDGHIERVAGAPGKVVAAVPQHGRAAASLATALAGIALPLLAAGHVVRPGGRRRVRSLGLVVVTAVASVVLFHAAAAGRTPALAACLPAALLLFGALLRYRSPSWRVDRK